MSGCPIRYAMGMFGDRWTLVIIRDIMFRGKRYYSELMASADNISTNILADRLNSLEEKGIISKTSDTQNRTKNIYNLTEKGKALIPVMLTIIDWSERYDDETTVPEDFIKNIRQNPKRTEKEILKAIDQNENYIGI